MTERFVWNYKTPNERVCSAGETRDIIKEIFEEITVKNEDLIYKHEVGICNF